MKFFTLSIFLISVVAVVVRAAPPTSFTNTVEVFRHFAKEVYPHDNEQQRKAVVTLRYLFGQDNRWKRSDHLVPAYDFLASGGLMENAKSLNRVTLEDANSHLVQGTLYTDPRFLKPSMNTLVNRHYKQARKAMGDEGELIRDAGGQGRGLFETTPRPLTTEEAQEVQSRLDAATSSRRGGGGGGGDRVHGLPWEK